MAPSKTQTASKATKIDLAYSFLLWMINWVRVNKVMVIYMLFTWAWLTGLSLEGE